MAEVRGRRTVILRLVAARVKIAASLILRDELSRYLEPCLLSLLEFCDEVRVLDDGSTDGWYETLKPGWGDATSRVHVLDHSGHGDQPAFHSHAQARNRLVAWSMEGGADYVLAVDADEFVTDGAALRRACEFGSPAVSLTMREVWEACDDCLCIREDGGWRSHDIAICWRPDAVAGRSLAIRDLGHATGRVPEAVNTLAAMPSGVSVLHFGWANRQERAVRYERYAVGDGGQFHALAHIQSIMWPDEKVECDAMDWPAGLADVQGTILERANR